MEFYDISVPIRGDMPVYAGDPRVRIRPAAQITKGNSFNSLLLSLSSHTGTHVDAPSHFEANSTSVDQLPLDVFYGPTLVQDVGDVQAVDEETLKSLAIPQGTKRLLIKSHNSQLWTDSHFHQQFVYLTYGGARWLVEQGLRLVGVDYLSIEEFGSLDFATHHTLLQAEVVILEGLDLRRVSPGEYTISCFPLRIADGDGAPARAILMKEEG